MSRETAYRVIKRSIREGIASGEWPVGALLPSEPALSATFRVSRMTVNRAMRELAAERYIRRVPGVGTFVAEPVAQSGLVEIRNIADEIAARGHVHRAVVLRLAEAEPPAPVASDLGLAPGAPAYHSILVHEENGVPLQVEDRYVRPDQAPGYLEQDFLKATPNEFLSRVAPLSEAEHVVSAINADPVIAAHLRIRAGEACLRVTRRTFSGGQPVSVAELTYPGSRFRLGGRFGAHPMERDHG